MKKTVVGAMGAVLMMLAGCGGGGDASCSLCGQALSDTQCMAIATSQGCSSGESYDDPMCGGQPTRGCHLHGCPAGPVMCSVASPDGGADAAP